MDWVIHNFTKILKIQDFFIGNLRKKKLEELNSLVKMKKKIDLKL